MNQSNKRKYKKLCQGEPIGAGMLVAIMRPLVCKIQILLYLLKKKQ